MYDLSSGKKKLMIFNGSHNTTCGFCGIPLGWRSLEKKLLFGHNKIR